MSWLQDSPIAPFLFYMKNFLSYMDTLDKRLHFPTSFPLCLTLLHNKSTEVSEKLKGSSLFFKLGVRRQPRVGGSLTEAEEIFIYPKT